MPKKKQEGQLMSKKTTEGLQLLKNLIFGAAELTEEHLFKRLNDFGISKDQIWNLIKTTRTDLVDVASRELRHQLSKIDLLGELQRILEQYEFDIQATVSLRRKDKHSDQKTDQLKSALKKKSPVNSKKVATRVSRKKKSSLK